MKIRALLVGCTVSLVCGAACADAVSAGTASKKPEEMVDCPVSENVRGHENIEWSTSYAYHLTDEKKALPRVLLVGDSICNAYKDKVGEALEGKMAVTYWASSYCLTSPNYLKFLSIYLDEAEYAVVHFNNGLHSLNSDPVAWERAFRKTVELVRTKQPKAKLVWTPSTPLKDPVLTEKAKALNAIAAKVVAEYKDIAIDDLFSLMDPLDRKDFWSDTYHFNSSAVEMQAKQVATTCLRAAMPDNAKSEKWGGFESARRDCAELGKLVERLEAKGGGQYSRMSYEVIRYSLEAMAKDLSAGYTNRVIRGMKEVSKILPQALAKAKRIEAGKEKDIAVPRFKSGPVKIRGPILYGDREWPDGRIEHDKPVMLNGWGHFGCAQRDLELLNRMGHNYLQMEVGFNKFFPKPDVVATNAFDGFFAVADRAQKADTKIDLHLCVHYMAGWPLAKSAASKFCRNHFISFCVHDPYMVGVMTNFQRQAAKLTKDHPALASYCLTNEPGSQDVSKCSHMKAVWEAYLAERYGTPAKMNELWQTNFTDFAAVPMPAYPKLPKTPLGLEFVRCDRQAFADFHAKLAKAVRDVAPNVPLHAKTTVDVSLGTPKECFFWSMDAARFAEIFDLIDHDGVHCYGPQGEWMGDWIRSQVGYDFIRSFADKPMINTENHIIQDHCAGYGIPKEHVYSALWQDAIHGQRATAHWTWERGGKASYSKAFYGLAPERPEILEMLGRCSLDLQRFSDELVPIQEESPTVVILWSLSSKVLGKSHDYPYAPVSFLGEPVGFVNEEALSRYLRDGVKCRSLRSARVIVMFGVTHLPDESVAALKKLEREGVSILAVGDTLAFDDLGRPRGETPWPSRAEAKDHPIFDLLVAERGKWNLQPRPRLVRPVYGIETHGYEKDGVCRLSICNQVRGPVEIELPSEGVDLISGKKVAKRFKLAPLMPMFVEYRK